MTMKQRSTLTFIVGIVALSLLQGCGTTKEDWEAARWRDTVTSYERFLTQHPDSEYSAQATNRIEHLREAERARLEAENRRVAEERKKREEEARAQEEKKERLRVIRLYDGGQRARDTVAVILSGARGLRSPKFSKPGIAGVFRVDDSEIDCNLTEQIECLPGQHTITLVVQFRPDNVPEGTLAISSSRVDRTVNLKAGSQYRIVFDPEKHEANISEVDGR